MLYVISEAVGNKKTAEIDNIGATVSKIKWSKENILLEGKVVQSTFYRSHINV